MLPNRLIKGFDKRRLRNFLALFFVALAIPTVVLIWQAYSQLKWEAFHQYRGVAEELARRIDTQLDDMMRTADARSFADYEFLVVTGDPSANFVQRSPLSSFPVEQELPGILGYFQVDSNGAYSSPLLPPDGTAPASVGIGDAEYRERLALAQEIQTILADNSLVQARSDSDVYLGLASPAAVPAEEPKATSAKEDQSQQMFDQLSKLSADSRAYRERASNLELDDELQKKLEAEEQEVASTARIESRRVDVPGRAKRREQTAASFYPLSLSY